MTNLSQAADQILGEQVDRSKSSKRLDLFMLIAVAMFVLGFFFIREKFKNDIYYAFVLLPFVLFRARVFWQLLKTSLPFQVISLYIAYMMLSISWTQFTPDLAVHKGLVYGLYIFGFVAALIYLWEQPQLQRFTQYTDKYYIAVAAASAVFSIFYFYYVLEHSFPNTRMETIFSRQYPVQTGHLYSLGIILGIYTWSTLAARGRVLLGIAMLCCAFGLMLTHSRGPMVGLAAALFVMLFLPLRKTKLWGLFVIAVGVVFYDVVTDGGVRLLFERADAGRFTIYKNLLARMPGHEIFGLGFLSDSSSPLGHPINIFCHSTSLCAYYHGGAVGLLIYIVMFALFFFWAFQHYLRSGSSKLLVWLLFGLTCYTYDGGRLLYHPRTEWIIIWIPMAFIAIEWARNKTSQNLSSSHK